MKNLSAFILLLLSSYVLAQTPAEKLIAEGQLTPTLEINLRVLTDEIGGRVPGTPAMDRAEQWGLAACEALIQGTHLDDQLKAFMLWKSWVSGKRGRPR